MSTTLQEPISRQATSPAQRLRTTMAAVRVSMSWFGTRKSLTAEQKAEAAEPFGAKPSSFRPENGCWTFPTRPTRRLLPSPPKTSVHGFWVQGQLALPSS